MSVPTTSLDQFTKRVLYRNHTFCIELTFLVEDSPTQICPGCLLLKRTHFMSQREDIHGVRWWFCQADSNEEKWAHCGLIFPVGIPADDEGLIAMVNNRVAYIQEVRAQDN